MSLELEEARRILKDEADRASESTIDKTWVKYIEEISKLCEEAQTRTHVAFLGTAILAKATDPTIDVFSIKSIDRAGSYSARTLAHNVLVPMAPALGVHLGVTGREPLNNQPYFRMERLDDGTRIHKNASKLFARLIEVIHKLSKVSQQEAKRALRSFVYVRRNYQPKYLPLSGQYNLSSDDLTTMIRTFVGEESDGGKRAQAVVAGLLDIFAGEERVFAGRVNDPSRHYPGDVAVRLNDDSGWEKAFEVRDKAVSFSDIQIFTQKCVLEKVREVGIVAISSVQTEIRLEESSAWAKYLGIGMRIFTDWRTFVVENLFWSPSTNTASLALTAIHNRLVEIEAPEASVKRWMGLAELYRVKPTK